MSYINNICKNIEPSNVVFSPFSYIDINNNISKNLHEKLGFTLCHEKLAWCKMKKVDPTTEIS